MIGGQVGVAGHITIGDNVKIQGQTGVTSNIKNGVSIQGTPAMIFKDYSKSYIYFRKFPDIVKRLENLEKQL
jgi:UDP-3-O-[3-hydroxymyristoyl] glucosamine N-acyltransferase